VLTPLAANLSLLPASEQFSAESDPSTTHNHSITNRPRLWRSPIAS
jgi:hypothetical protein